MKASFFRQAAVIGQREWAGYFNTPVAYIFLVIFLALAGFFTFSVSQFYEIGQADLRPFFFWHPWLYLILAPAVAMRLWSEEKRAGTDELLFTLSVTPLQAVAGKFAASWLFLTLGLALTFPVVWTAFYLGAPDTGVIFTGYLGSMLLAGAYLAVGMFTSSLTRNQVISFVLSVAIGLFLIVCGYPPVTQLFARWAPAWLVEGVAGFGFMPHFEALQRGVVDLRDLLYFASVIVFMLALTHISLKTGRK